jgi:hypothetical protein
MRPKFALAAIAIAAIACSAAEHATGGISTDYRVVSGLASCGSTKGVFTIPPVALADFFGWVPLGNLNPPGHTFPTDHQYIYVNNPESSAPRRTVNVVAPSDIVITHARTSTESPDNITDYTIDFTPCAEVAAEFGHVLTIDPSILSQIGAIDQFCNSYSPSPGSTYTSCESANIAIKVSAGTVIGTAGGPAPHSFGLDFSLWDAREAPLSYANPARWNSSPDKIDQLHVAGASDYFAEPAATQIAPRVGSFDGVTARTALPLGGKIDFDVLGTALGIWFNPSQPTQPEYNHFAIVPDNIDPSKIDISPGLLRYWTRGLVSYAPQATGFVNRNPVDIKADSHIYCMEYPGAWAMLMQLSDDTTLWVEASTATSCAAAQPYAFTNRMMAYKR